MTKPTEGELSSFINSLGNGSFQYIKYFVKKFGKEYLEHTSGLLNWAPLMRACSENGKVEIIKYLLDNNVDIESKDSNGYTAINHAVQYGTPEQILYLAARGAKLPVEEDAENPILLSFIDGGGLENLDTLLTLGVKINTKHTKYNNNTALTHCVYYNRPKTAQYLITKGANPFIKNDFGLTAREVANSYYKNKEIIEFHNTLLLKAEKGWMAKELQPFHTGLPYVIKDLPDKMTFKRKSSPKAP